MQQSLEWPPLLRDKIQTLGEAQEYERMWRAVLRFDNIFASPKRRISTSPPLLSVFFPAKRGFRIGRYLPSDGPHQRRLCVRIAQNDIVLMIFWDIPYFPRYGLEHEQNHINGPDEGFARHMVPCIWTTGLLLGIGRYVNSARSPRPTYSNPQNWLYEVSQQGGLSLLFNCVTQVYAALGKSSKTIDVNFEAAWEAIALNEGEVTPPLPQDSQSSSAGRLLSKRGNGEKISSVDVRQPDSDKAEESQLSSFPRPFPPDLMSMFAEYLSIDELKEFSLVSSVTKRAAQHRIWTAFTISWGENDDPNSSLDDQLSALFANPERTLFIESLSIYCRWSWNAKRLEQFGMLIPLLPNLKRLSLNQLPFNSNRIRVIGNEYRPLLRLMVDIKPSFKLEYFKLVEEFRRPAPLFKFLYSQPSIKTLEGCILRFGLKGGIPSDLLPCIQALHVHGVHGGIWGNGRNLQHLTVCLTEPTRSRGSETLGKVLNDIGLSAQGLESLAFGKGFPILYWIPVLEVLEGMHHLQKLRLDEHSLSVMGDPHSSASRVVSGLLSLRQLGFGLKMRHYEGSNEIEEELRCLQELPTRICHVVLHADGRTWERDNSRLDTWLKDEE